MRYRLTVERIQPHPKAGERDYSSGFPAVYPATETTQVLVMDVEPEQFDAIRRAALEAAK